MHWVNFAGTLLVVLMFGCHLGPHLPRLEMSLLQLMLGHSPSPDIVVN